MTAVAEPAAGAATTPPTEHAMTSTAVAVRQDASALPAKIQYAKALADSGLLPSAYRKQPANVLYAVEYGDMLGLPPMAAITGIHIIEGKPTASAGLISALVRRAGHKLRVTGDSRSATCQIIRSDDPDYTFTVTWTLSRNADGNPSAEEAKLTGKQVWQQYPASMLKSRAITQCARDACEEALYGLHYTPEELGAEVDEDGAILGAVTSEPAAANGSGRATPDDDPWYVHPAAERDEAWLTGARERAASVPGTPAATALWAEIGEKLTAGEIAKDDADQLADLIKARVADLKDDEAKAAGEPAEVAEGELVDDDPDGWMAKAADVLTADDADAAEADLAQVYKGGSMTRERRDEVADAITARRAAVA